MMPPEERLMAQSEDSLSSFRLPTFSYKTGGAGNILTNTVSGAVSKELRGAAFLKDATLQCFLVPTHRPPLDSAAAVT